MLIHLNSDGLLGPSSLPSTPRVSSPCHKSHNAEIIFSIIFQISFHGSAYNPTDAAILKILLKLAFKQFFDHTRKS